MEYAKVLIIDDNIDFAKTFVEYVEDNNEPIEVIEIAETGEKGLEAIERIGIGNINIIWLDNVMPDLEGTEVLDLLSKKYNGIYQKKVFFFSGFLSAKMTEQLQKYDLAIPPMKKGFVTNIFYKISERIKIYADYSSGAERVITENDVVNYIEGLEWNISESTRTFIKDCVYLTLIKNEDMKKIQTEVAKKDGSTYFYVAKTMRQKIKKHSGLTTKEFISKAIEDLQRSI